MMSGFVKEKTKKTLAECVTQATANGKRKKRGKNVGKKNGNEGH